jgi:hypothetical protein
VQVAGWHDEEQLELRAVYLVQKLLYRDREKLELGGIRKAEYIGR